MNTETLMKVKCLLNEKKKQIFEERTGTLDTLFNGRNIYDIKPENVYLCTHPTCARFFYNLCCISEMKKKIVSENRSLSFSSSLLLRPSNTTRTINKKNCF